jgi:DNA/RNA-binding domain of Phe-tRNA-synthetase-like protein
MKFIFAPEVAALGVKGACLVIDGIANRERDARFEQYRSDLFARLKSEYTAEMIAQDPILAGYRNLHQKVGRSNRRFPASPESLVKMFLRNDTIPAINLAVDIYNCLSLETRLSIGAHDVDKVDGNIALRLADGSEHFVPLGKDKPELISAGDYGYFDDSREVLCRLEYRQADKTKVTVSTTTCFYMIQGNENTSSETIMDAVNRLVDVTTSYCGGSERILWTHL